MASGWYLWLALAVVVVAALAIAWAVSRRRVPVDQPTPRGRAPVDRVRSGLLATRERLAARLDAVLGRDGDPGRLLADLEEALVAADVGVRTSAELIARLRNRAVPAGGTEMRRALRDEIVTLLEGGDVPVPSARPWVVLVLGVNGVGKTTTIGKLAAVHAAAGRKVLLVAGDTFRAAAIDQLVVWGQRTGAPVVHQAAGASPAAVVFDGMKAALARDVDVVLIDTAGRLHTRTNLVEELRKVERVVAREVPGAPHETLLVLDATTGQNAIAQARTFADAVKVTGLVLTKLDGTARGGVAIAIRREVGIPIRYVGVGEAVDDLRPFDAGVFAGALLEPEASTTPLASSVA